jgi:hypothetical protein
MIMLNARQQEIANLLQTAQASKWAYAQINDYWEALANPVQYGRNMARWVADYEYAHQQHLTLLTDAGFQGADILYKRDILAIYAGVKV